MGKTELSLNQASLVSLLLRNKIQTIRMEIEALTEMLENDQDPVKMGEIQELIGVSPFAASRSDICLHVVCLKELLSQVTAIRDAATESEVVVRDITRDIQSLDLAKRNLVASMNALKRFQMLGRSDFHPTHRSELTPFARTSERFRSTHETGQISSIPRDCSSSRCSQAALVVLQDLLECRTDSGSQ